MKFLDDINYPKLKKDLIQSFKDNPEYFKILANGTFSEGHFVKKDYYDNGNYFKFSLYETKNESLICYGHRFIVKNNKLIQKKDKLCIIDKNLQIASFPFINIKSDHNVLNIHRPIDNIFWGSSNITVMVLANVLKKHSWINFYQEYGINMQISTILKHKLFSLKKLAHFLLPGIPFPTVKKLLDLNYNKNYTSLISELLNKNSYENGIAVTGEGRPMDEPIESTPKFGLFDIVQSKNLLTNIGNFNFDLISYPNYSEAKLWDFSINMAAITGEKINCAWSKRRLEEYLDEMSFKVTNIFGMYKDQNLSPDIVFKNFSDFSGIPISKTFKEIVLMGLENRNCIGTYWERINSGECMIYKYKNCAFQLVKEFKIKDFETKGPFLALGQIYGKYNSNVDQWLKDEISEKILEYNIQIEPEYSLYKIPYDECVEMPCENSRINFTYDVEEDLNEDIN